jgi:hypothetical protein
MAATTATLNATLAADCRRASEAPVETGPLARSCSLPCEHRRPIPAKAPSLGRTEHSRQPDESWWCSHQRAFDALWPVFFRRVPDCELLFLAKVLGVEVMTLFPAKLDLKKLDPTLRLKVSTNFPRRKFRRS